MSEEKKRQKCSCGFKIRGKGHEKGQHHQTGRRKSANR